MKTFLTAALLTIAASITIFANPALAGPSTCDAKSEITEYYQQDDFLAYRYEGAQAAAIIGEFSKQYGPPPAGLTTVYLGFDKSDGTLAFFFYNSQGCQVKTTDGWVPEDVQALFDKLGLMSPIGSTYSQIPNSPGGTPGI